jgi:hypothetical protein
VPGTDDPGNIQGALRPLSMRCELVGELQHTTIPCDAAQTSLTRAKLGSCEVTESKIVNSTTSLHFRDDDHSGEAPLEEIVAGFEEGELSHHCQIFDTDMDEWVIISVFFRKHGIGIPTDAVVDQTDERVGFVPCDNTTNTQLGMGDTDCDLTVVQIEEDDDELPLLDKHDKKKPARDSSYWGKGRLLPCDAIQNSTGEECRITVNHENVTSYRTKKVGHVKPPAKLMRTVTQAMVQWDMLEDGDRLLLGLSGGKDSLSLLHVLLEFQRKLPIRFDIEVSELNLLASRFRSACRLKRTYSPTFLCFACRSAQLIR